jgi:hypothetical protein
MSIYEDLPLVVHAELQKERQTGCCKPSNLLGNHDLAPKPADAVVAPGELRIARFPFGVVEVRSLRPFDLPDTIPPSGKRHAHCLAEAEDFLFDKVPGVWLLLCEDMRAHGELQTDEGEKEPNGPGEIAKVTAAHELPPHIRGKITAFSEIIRPAL